MDFDSGKTNGSGNCGSSSQPVTEILALVAVVLVALGTLVMVESRSSTADARGLQPK